MTVPRYLRVGLTAGLLVAIALGSFLATDRMLHGTPTTSLRHPQRGGEGVEVLAIFIASSTCGASEFPGLLEAMKQIRGHLKARAIREEKVFVSVGVALDQDPVAGISFLEKFGPFDELASGGGWMNGTALTFVTRDMPAEMAIPQLIIVERAVTSRHRQIEGAADRLVARKVGADAIVTFALSLGRTS